MAAHGRRPPNEVLAYASALTDVLVRVPAAEVLAVYLHGSAALGGWRSQVSDVDLLVVLADNVDPMPAGALADAAVSTLALCPGTGLELSVVTRAGAAAPRQPWRFVVHIGGSTEGEPAVVMGEGHAGDPDLLLHYAVCREVGWRLMGPPAVEVIGPVPRPAVLSALADELEWGLEHAPSPYAVLNACRALLYLQEGQLVAKVTGGRWALALGFGPSGGVRRALAAQIGDQPAADLTDSDVAFVQRTARRLSAASQGAR